jgi:predicted amidohydrolase YtcJ
MAQHAELVFAAGPVYTADGSRRRVVQATAPDGSPATAVAVAGGRVAAIGHTTDVQIADLTTPATEVVNLSGRALLRGSRTRMCTPRLLA